MMSPKIAPSLRGSSLPRDTLFLGPSPLIIPNGISIGSAVFVWSQMLCCTMHCQWGRKPQNCPFPLGFRHPAGGGPSHGHNNIQKLVKIVRVVRRYPRGQTDTHTDVLITILRKWRKSNKWLPL